MVGFGDHNSVPTPKRSFIHGGPKNGINAANRSGVGDNRFGKVSQLAWITADHRGVVLVDEMESLDGYARRTGFQRLPRALIGSRA